MSWLDDAMKSLNVAYEKGDLVAVLSYCTYLSNKLRTEHKRDMQKRVHEMKDEDKLAKVAKKLLDKGEVELAREVLAVDETSHAKVILNKLRDIDLKALKELLATPEVMNALPDPVKKQLEAGEISFAEAHALVFDALTDVALG